LLSDRVKIVFHTLFCLKFIKYLLRLLKQQLLLLLLKVVLLELLLLL